MDKFAYVKALRGRHELTPAEFQLLVILWTYTDGECTHAHPGAGRLAADLGKDRRLVKRQIQSVVAKGYLRVEQEGGSAKGSSRTANTYTLTLPTGGAEVPQSSDMTGGAEVPQSDMTGGAEDPHLGVLSTPSTGGAEDPPIKSRSNQASRRGAGPGATTDVALWGCHADDDADEPGGAPPTGWRDRARPEGPDMSRQVRQSRAQSLQLAAEAEEALVAERDRQLAKLAELASLEVAAT